MSLAGCGAPELLNKITPDTSVTVVSAEGSATLSGRPLSAGTRIQSGETIVSEDGSTLVVKIKDRAALRMKNAAKVVFDEMGETIALNLDYGALMSVVAPSKQKFLVRTPGAVAGVRGTAFYMESRSIDQTYICLCEGKLDVATPDTALQIAAAHRSHHTPVLISSDKTGKLSAGPAPMINHTNADITSLESVLRK